MLEGGLAPRLMGVNAVEELSRESLEDQAAVPEKIQRIIRVMIIIRKIIVNISSTPFLGVFFLIQTAMPLRRQARVKL